MTTQREPRDPLLRASRFLIRAASILVPGHSREGWRDQWHAELAHRAHHGGAVALWSTGAVRHAWYHFLQEIRMDTLIQDLRYAWRSFATGRGLVAVAVLSIALGIGAVTAIFTAIDAFLLQPLPIPQAERVVRVHLTHAERGWSEVSLSHGDFKDLRARSRTLDLATARNVGFNLASTGDPERLRGALVSANYFRVFGIEPVLGRSFDESEEVAGRDAVVLISDGLWQRRFGARSDVLGETLLLDNREHEVVGVLPPAPWLRYTRGEIWKPFAPDAEASRASRTLAATARLEPGVSMAQANEELQALTAQLAEEHPIDNEGIGGRLEPLRDTVYDQSFRTASLVAFVAVLLVLLISCANAANLLLTRASSRAREVALRGALGAGRSRIVKQFLAEALLIAGLGGVFGVVIAWGCVRALRQLFGDLLPQLNAVQVDLRALGFCLALTLLTGLLFGLSPALSASKAPFSTLRASGRGAPLGGTRLRRGLVVAEVALALTLLVVSALLVQGYMALSNHDTGFDHRDVLTFRLTLPEAEYATEEAVELFYRELLERTGALAGVEKVAATTILPGDGSVATYYATEPGLDSNEQPVASFRSVLPGYFDALDIPLLEGRLFREGPFEPANALLVNASFARRHWPGESAVGKQLYFSAGPREILGVVADSRDEGLSDDPSPMLFFSALRGRDRSLAWVVEARRDAEVTAEALAAAVHSLDPTLPLDRMAPLTSLLRDDIASDVILPRIMSALAALALVLALAGVFGVMTFLVGQRTHEMGVRLALGATNDNLVRLVVRQGVRLTAVGVVFGTILALAFARALASFLWEVSPFDPLTFGLACAALLAAGAAASWIPARKATRANPIAALRSG